MAVIAPLNLAVAAVGVFIFAVGLLGVVRPSSFTALIQRVWASPPGFGLVIVMRAAFGFLLIAAASGTRFPKVSLALGALSLIKAASIPLLGRVRQQNLIKWWCHHPARYIRHWSLLACAFGAFLIYTTLSVGNPETFAMPKSQRLQSVHGGHRDAGCTLVYVSALLLRSSR